ncbi:MAG: hypothetical protein ACRELY_09835 [Polyangiaceae bacterium]
MQHLVRRSYDRAALLSAHPPRLRHPHKQKIFALAPPPTAGAIHYARFAPIALPERVPSARPALTVRPTVFEYPAESAGIWHVNFADPQLFIAYGSALLAQDELQVLEHPILGSVREALLAEDLPAVTEENNRPTPVLVVGAERSFDFDTAPDIERPLGLYGNRFAMASFEHVQSALRVIDPPTQTNLIAMAAPVGNGKYSNGQIERVLVTAFTAFSAAIAESRARWPDASVEVRTGFWGCGAFGGNRTVMVLLQILASRLAGVDRLFFYTVSEDGIADVERGVAELESLTPKGDELVASLVDRIARRGFSWGTSDGN